MKILIIFTTCLIFQAFQLSGQFYFDQITEINTDSINQTLPQLSGINKIEALNKISFALCSKNPDSAFKLINDVLALSKSMEYKKGIADGFLNLGYYYYYQDSLRSTMTNFLKAVRIYEEINPTKEYAFLLSQIAFINLIAGRFNKIRDYAKRSWTIFHNLGNRINEADALHFYAISYLRNNIFDTAFFYYDKELQLRDTTKDFLRTASIYHEIGIAYMDMYFENYSEDDLIKAFAYWHKSYDIFKVKNLKYYTATLPFFIGYLHTKLSSDKNLTDGQRYLLESKKIVESSYPYNGDMHLLPMIYNGLGQISFKFGKTNKAIQFLEKGLRIAKDSLMTFKMLNYDDPMIANVDRHYLKIAISEIYNTFYIIDTTLNNYKNALKHQSLMEQAQNDIYEEEITNLIILQEAESENEKTSNQINLLASENEIKDLKIKQTRIYLFALGGFVLIIILMALLFVRQNKIRAEHNSVVLEQKLLRLQMNPHFIFNAFSNILRLIDTNDNKKASEYLTTFGKLLRTTLESTREDMVPFEKEVSTLRNYLDLQKFRYPEKFNYSLEIDEKIDQQDMSIPPMLVQPFIENAIEHGIRHKKTIGQINVSFELKDKKIVCEIEDDGVGREKAWEAEYSERGDRKSLSTKIIKDRIQVLNKKFKQKIKLEIIDKRSDTKEAIGTKVLIEMPYGSVY